MIRKSILSILGGACFAALFSFATAAEAGCGGLCSNRIGNYIYVGCEPIVNCVYDTVNTPDCRIVGVSCFYIDGGGPAPVSPGTPIDTE